MTCLGLRSTVKSPQCFSGSIGSGEPVSAPPIGLAKVEGFGLYILDGIDGPFRVEADAIRAYCADSD